MAKQKINIIGPTTDKGIDPFKGAKTESVARFDFMYISRGGRLQELTLESVSRRNVANFRVFGSKRKVKKSLSDLHLVPFEHWQDSAKQVIKIGKSYLLQREYTDIESLTHVPKELKYVFPEWVNQIAIDILSDSNILLTGDHGSGKSTVIMQIAARTKTPCVRIQCSSDMTVESFLGGYVPSSSGGAVWSDGLLTRAARKGWWVILDEFDTCNASVRTVLNGVLEVPNRLLSISDKDGGEILSSQNKTIHPFFRVFCTGNSFGSNAGNADLYGGTLEQNAAQNSRFNIYHIRYLTEAELFKVIKFTVPELKRQQIHAIVKYATTVNNSNIPGVKFSTRTAIAVAKKLRYGSPFIEAIGPPFINHYEEAIGRKLLTLAGGIK